MKRGLKSFVTILIAIFIIGAVFYSFLFWKVSNVPNLPFSFSEKISIIFTRNPAELLSAINNADKLKGTPYKNNEEITPVSSFLDLNKLLEQTTKKPVFFSPAGNTIVFDKSGKSVVNRGTFFMEDNNKYEFYDYGIYLNATKAINSYDTDHKAGISIVKKGGNINSEDLAKYKEFSRAVLLVEKKIDWKNTKGMNDLKISATGYIINQFQFSYGNSTRVDRNIVFDLAGNITEDITN